jgi:hypothetical protein
MVGPAFLFQDASSTKKKAKISTLMNSFNRDMHVTGLQKGSHGL